MNQKMKPIVTAVLLVLVILPVLPALGQRHFDTDILKDTFAFDASTPRSVDFDKLVQACPVRDCIRSIDNPRFVTADQAGFLNDEDLILGVVIGGDARAYPAKILDQHEIVNDTVGGQPIAITYCPLCGSGVAVSRLMGDVVTEFGVSGVLYNSDLVMYDRASNTLWSQVDATGIVGPNTGKELETLPVTMTRWARWQKKHPNGKVLSTDTGFEADYSIDQYAQYRSRKKLFMRVSDKDNRVHPKTVVFGASIDGQPVAVTEAAFENSGEIEASVAGRNLTLAMADDGAVTILDRDSREEWSTGRLFWFAWYTFNPSTELVQEHLMV